MRDGSDDAPRWMVWALALIIVLLLTPQFALGLFAPDTGQVAFMQDDSFYYAEIARRFSEEGRITFDGINPTNGFHPLYFLVVSALAKLLPSEFYLNGIYMLHVIFVGIGAWIFAMQLKGMSVWGRLILLAFALHPKVLFTLWSNAGMEASLAFAAAAWTMVRFRRATAARYCDHSENAIFALSATVLMLSRLDAILIVVPLALWSFAVVIREDGFRAMPRLLSLFAAPVVICGIYIGLNIWATGHVTPVSSAAKRFIDFPPWTSLATITYGWNTRHIVLAVAPSCIALAGMAAAPFHWRRDPPLAIGFVLGGVGVLAFSFYLAFLAPNAFNWYLGAIMGVAAWISGNLIAFVPFPRGPRPWRLVALPVLAVIIGLERTDDHNGRLEFAWGSDMSLIGSADLMRLGQDLSRVTEPGDIAAMHDAGKVGYFSDIPVVNLDGLANSYDYLENVKMTGRYQEYFDEIGLTHVILRTLFLTDEDGVMAGDYSETSFTLDPRIRFSREDEIFRRSVAEGFTVVVFRYPGRVDG